MSTVSIQAPAAARDGTHDFDFLHGSWRVHNRRLRRVLMDSTDWYEFEGTATERPVWDGQANLEEYDAVSPAGRIRGLALRLYEPSTRQWTISWSGSATGRLDPPMRGEFRDGRGEFHGQDEHDGKPIRVRFIWTSASANACQWEQAFSADAGETWETNWIMEFTRDQ
jgi:hypothetical protein